MSNWQPVILCGGSGTRLWPLSREQHPKQFVALGDGESLFQQTLRRVAGLGAPLIVSHERHRFLVSEQMRALGCEPGAILLEPVGRNSAPALTLAALWARAHRPEDLLLVLPSDHAMQDAAAFRSLLPRAAELAAAGRIVTFGVRPDRPETAYGYIQADGERIKAFVEKPDAATAADYVALGHLWNSGMFALSAATWLAELGRYAPDLLAACEQAFAEGQPDAAFYRPSAAFAACPAQAIDTAVMEQTSKGAVLPLAAGWSDVGSWDAFGALGSCDADGNTCEGDVMTLDASDNLLRSSGRLVTAVGVRNLLVIETADAILVADRNRAQDVRGLVDQLRAQSRPEAEHHRKVARPWGAYESVDRGPRFQVKRITVHPGESLSLQMHHHRSEHWIVVQGAARVTRGDEVFLLSENQSAYIPVGTVHRLENPGSIDLELIEVQSGSYLGEDDIVRLEDRYQRHLAS